MKLPDNVRPPQRILLVDDEPVVLRLMAETLRSAGYRVDTAEDGALGLRIFEALPYDLVVTDQSMPHFTGEELASAIRGLRPNIPIVLVTGLPCRNTAAGLFDAILAKPFRSQQLIDAVASLLAAAPFDPSWCVMDSSEDS